MDNIEENTVTLYPTARKVFAALVVAAPLTLVACGSGTAEDAAPASSADATVTSAIATTAEEKETDATESTATASEATDPEIEPTSDDPVAAAAEAAEAELEQELQNIQVYQQAPVEAKGPVDESDVTAISDLVGGAYQQTTLRGWVSYVPENSCQPLLDDVSTQMQAEYGTNDLLDFSVIPDTPLAEVPQYAEAHATLDRVDNVAINGNQASAEVTVNSGGQSDTSTMRFLREGDRWTFCSEQYN